MGMCVTLSIGRVVEMTNKFEYVGSIDELFSEDGYAVSDDNPYASSIDFSISLQNSNEFLMEHFMNNVEMVDSLELGMKPAFYYDDVYGVWIMRNDITFHIFM